MVPGIHPYFYIGTDALNHTEQYTEAAGEQAIERVSEQELRVCKALSLFLLSAALEPILL